MMGSAAEGQYVLQKVLRQIDGSHLRKRSLRRARQTLDSDTQIAVLTPNGYLAIRESALYWYMSALIWMLQNDDEAVGANFEEARNCKDRTKKLEADVLHEQVALLMRHGWRIDVIGKLLKRIVYLYEEEPALHAHTLTTWGRFLNSQGDHDEAYAKLTGAERLWTNVQKRPGHIMGIEEKQRMMDSHFQLLKMRVVRGADPAVIKEMALKTLRYDRRPSHKAVAANVLRPRTRKTSNA